MSLSLRQRSWWHWLTLERLVALIVFVAIFTMAARFPLDTDGWWHLQSGRWIVENGSVPLTDPFSHTRFGQPWIDHGWLAQILIYLTYDGFGFGGLVLLVAFLVTLAFYFAWLQCAQGNRWLRAFVLIAAAVASGIIWSARPQMVTFVLSSVVAFILYAHRQGRRRIIWWLPAVMLLWANVHGGFAVGFILILAYVVGEVGNLLLGTGTAAGDGQERPGWREPGKLAAVGALSFLVLALNPNGIQMWTYPLRTVGIGVLQDFILEWQPPDFHQLYLHPFIWLLLAALTAFGLAGRRADFTDLTLTAVFIYLSLLAVRNVPLFALIVSPVIVRYGSLALARWRGAGQARAGFAALNWVLLLLILGAGLLRVGQQVQAAAVEAQQPQGLPAAAVDYLQQAQPPGPIFNSYNWGGYLIWRLPQYPVFVDGRTDLYDDELLREYVTIYTAGQGWQDELQEQGIRLVLVERDSPLVREMGREEEWERVYHDAIASIFVRH